MVDVAQPLPIEDYAIIGDCTTAALVGRSGSIDWLCWPRFDSAACLSALLGTSRHGRWLIAPSEPPTATRRAYHDGSLVLETVFDTPTGSVAVIDLMPINQKNSTILRLVQGRTGQVAMRLELVLRFDYGTSIPWVEQLDEETGLCAIVGPERVVLHTPIKLYGQDLTTLASFTVSAGQTIPFAMTHSASHVPLPDKIDAIAALAETDAFWREWSSRSTYTGRYATTVNRSLLTLKALTYAATGGIVAAATTSLPEQLGGERNWDYRYCWLRDATLTLFAMMNAGYVEEAGAWRDWLHRAVAGSADQVQIMYGLAGERRLEEWTVPWLPGYQGASPVRIGNAAAGQLQLDVFGEVIDCLHQARRNGLSAVEEGWNLQRSLVERLEQVWREPDEGMWEVRGGRKHFTVSKVMAWVAFDRAIRDAERHHLPAPIERWRVARDDVHRMVLEQGFDTEMNSFTQSFGAKSLDAGLLLLPMVGFLPADDSRFLGTVAAIETGLLVDGFVLRYRTEDGTDGLTGVEGAFLACTFWLADAYTLCGRHDDAEDLFERLLTLCNDVGLLSEEYDSAAKRQVGNFPQAFSHVALVGTAMNLRGRGPAQVRATKDSVAA